jgi:signal peptidase I
MKLLKAFIRELAIPIAIALVVIALAVQAFKIPSGSMENTLYEGDFLLGLKFVYGVPIPFTGKKIPVSEPDTGDIVIFRYPGEPEYPDYNRKRYTHIMNALMFGNFFWDNEAPNGDPKLIHYADGPKDYIKRCVAKSGQRIKVENGKLFINGEPQTIKGQGKYTEKFRGNTPRDYLKEIKLPEPGETINLDSLSTHDLLWIRSLMIQEMPDSLVEIGISLKENGQELENYSFENFSVPLENHKWYLINAILSKNRIATQGLKMGDSLTGEIDLNFFRKAARTGFLARHNPNMPQKSLFGSRLVGYDSFDGSHLEDLEANVALDSQLTIKFQVLLNGRPISKYTIKDKVYFMMGDNRDQSADSRYFGFVSDRNIKAKAFVIYFSLEKNSRVELLKPWTWIFLPTDIRWSRVARIIHLI